MGAHLQFRFNRLIARSIYCLALWGGAACGYSIPDSTVAGTALWSSLQVAAITTTEPGPELSMTVSASSVLTYENVTFSPSGGTPPYRYRVSEGGGTLATSGLYTAGAVLGTNTIAVTDSAGSTATASVTVQGGLGNGTFTTGGDYGTLDGIDPMLFGDFTGDGVLDLIVATDKNPRGVSVLAGNGDGTFQTATTVEPLGAGGSRSMTAGDFNGDGNMDVAVGTTDTKFSVYLGNGDGTFMTPAEYQDPIYPIAVASGDMDNDGIVDMITGNLTGDSTSFWKGVADGTFQSPSTIGAVTNPRRVRIADFNNDGNLDFVVTNEHGGPSVNRGVTVFVGNGDGTFQAGVQYTAAEVGSTLTLGDFNGDGRVDIVHGAHTDEGDITLFLANGDGTFQTGLVTSLPTSGRTRHAAACDYNADSRLDLAVADRDDGVIVLLLGNGSGGFTVGPLLPAPDSPQFVLCRDLNGDSKMDIVVGGFDTTVVRVMLGN